VRLLSLAGPSLCQADMCCCKWTMVIVGQAGLDCGVGVWSIGGAATAAVVLPAGKTCILA